MVPSWADLSKKMSRFWLEPLVPGLDAQQAKAAELISTLALLASFGGIFSTIFYGVANQNPLTQLARLMGILFSAAAYFWSRWSRNNLVAASLILSSIMLPTLAAVVLEHFIETLTYVHIAIALSYFILPPRRALTAASIITLLIPAVLALPVMADQVLFVSANLIVGVAVTVALALVVRNRSGHLRLIEQQARQLVEFEKNRHELFRQRQQMDFLRRVVNNLGHDIKTPLSVIHLQAEMIEQSAAEPKLALRAGKINNAVTKIAEALEKMGQLDDAVTPVEETLQALELNQLVCEAMERRAPQERQAIELILAREPLNLKGNPDALHLALSSLIDNSFHHAGATVMVTIMTAARAGEIILTLTDTGQGIPREELASVFDYFYKVDKARTSSAAGPGLGLSIVKQIVNNHQGTVEMQSDLGQGIQITIRLPRQFQNGHA